jgi:hypothetical protein
MASFTLSRRFKTVADVVGAIARSFYLVPRFYWDENGDFHIVFAGRGSLVGEQIRVVDVADSGGSFEVDTERNNDNVLFRGRTSYHTLESNDGTINDKATLNESRQLVRSAATAATTDSGENKRLEIAFGIGSPVVSGTFSIGRILINTGDLIDLKFTDATYLYTTYQGLVDEDSSDLIPINGFIPIRASFGQSFPNIRDYNSGVFRGTRANILHALSDNNSFSTTAITFEAAPAKRISAISVSIADVPHKFFSLQAFCNFMQQRDFTFFASEYEINVPSLVAFVPNSTPTSEFASVENLQLGSQIDINHPITGNVRYAVVKIQYNLTDKATKLSLQQVARFDIADDTDGETGAETFVAMIDDTILEVFEIAPGQTITAGQLVGIVSNLAYLAQPTYDGAKYTYGVAVAIVGDFVTVQSSGRYPFGSVQAGTLYYLGVDGTITDNRFLTSPTAADGAIIEIGRAVNSTDIEMFINNTPYIYEEALPDPDPP